jgi:hypothetical protein
MSAKECEIIDRDNEFCELGKREKKEPVEI